MKPLLTVVPVYHLNSTPLSFVSVVVLLPRVITGSLTVTVLVLMVVVVPLMVKFPPTTMLPPTLRFSPMPTPPVTLRAPVVVDVEVLELVIEIALVVVAPVSVEVCKLTDVR